MNKEYEMSEQLFFNVWNSYSVSDYILDKEDIFEFLKEILDESKGLVVCDHFSQTNYDYIEAVEYDEPYLKIYWRKDDETRLKYLNEELTDDERMMWSFRGHGSYQYTLININKLKLINIQGHPFILLLSNMVPRKKVKSYLINKKNELIKETHRPDNFTSDYMFYEGDKKDFKIHYCDVYNLPYYNFLIQPKERVQDTSFSRKVMLHSTKNETVERIIRVSKRLDLIDDDPQYSDELYSIGNTIRTILEYTLKLFCLYKNIRVKNSDIADKYGYAKLGDLKKALSDYEGEIKIKQETINIANNLSHDSGLTFEKQDINNFFNEAKIIIKDTFSHILEKA